MGIKDQNILKLICRRSWRVYVTSDYSKEQGPDRIRNRTLVCKQNKKLARCSNIMSTELNFCTVKIFWLCSHYLFFHFSHSMAWSTIGVCSQIHSYKQWTTTIGKKKSSVKNGQIYHFKYTSYERGSLMISPQQPASKTTSPYKPCYRFNICRLLEEDKES